MKLKFEVATHRDKAGNWVAQVILADCVIHEDTGTAGESQAVANAATSFALLLAGAIQRQREYETRDAGDTGDAGEAIRYMDIGEFRSEGYLQELNRQFLHPLGLALEVVVGGDGRERLGGVWDYRDDPEGIRYGEGQIDPAKAAHVAARMGMRVPARHQALGYVMQPFPDGAE